MALPLLVDRCLVATCHVGVEDPQREKHRRGYPVRTTRVKHVHGDNSDDRQHARPPAEAKEDGEAHEKHPRELNGREQGASRERGGPEHEAVSATPQTPLKRSLLRLAGDGGLPVRHQHVCRDARQDLPERTDERAGSGKPSPLSLALRPVPREQAHHLARLQAAFVPTRSEKHGWGLAVCLLPTLDWKWL